MSASKLVLDPPKPWINRIVGGSGIEGDETLTLRYFPLGRASRWGKGGSLMLDRESVSVAKICALREKKDDRIDAR